MPLRRQPPGPDVLGRRELAEHEEVVAYRVVLTDDREHEDFVRSFMSRGALGLPPRRGTPEERHPSLAEGISAYFEREEAAQTARLTTFRIGRFTAELHLRPGMGVTIAVWGARGHLTVWGDPLILMTAVADIVSAEENSQ